MSSDNEIETIEGEPEKKYKKYDNDLLKFAVKKVKDGEISAYKAAIQYNIPRKTILWHKNNDNNQQHHKKRGAKNCLTVEEEKEMVKWIICNQKNGNPKTQDDLLEAAADVRKLRDDSSTPLFKNERPSEFWARSFIKRNENISIRASEAITAGAANVSEGQIRKFFTDIYNHCRDNNILEVLERPEAIINLDETGFELNPSLKRVLAEKGSKSVYNPNSSKGKEMITATFAFAADGTMLPTQILLKDAFSDRFGIGKAMGRSKTEFLLDTSINGWQTKATFARYVKQLVEGHLSNVEKPIIIFYDNHASHLDYELFKWCAERQVHIATFPPSTTHILQACDHGVFGSTKSGYRKVVTEYRRNDLRELDEIGFIEVLDETIKRTITAEKVRNAFKGTGLYPFNVENVHFERCIAKDPPTPCNDEQGDSACQTQYKPDEHPILEPLEKCSEISYGAEPSPESKNHLRDENQQPTCSKYLPENQHKNKVRVLAVETDSDAIISSIVSSMKCQNELLSDLYRKKNKNHAVFNCSLIQKVLESFDDINMPTSSIDYANTSPASNIKHSSNSLTPDTSNQNDSPETSEFETNSKEEQHKTISDILTVPERFRKKANRVFKKKNFGLLTGKEILDNYQQEFERLEAEDKKKEERKIEREQRKLVQQNILKIKKEKCSEDKVPKKRGRPRKFT